MGQKINPVGFRVGVIRGYDSHWFYDKKGYPRALLEDQQIRKFIRDRIGKGVISRVEIERAANRIKVTIFTSRPGAIIGKGGKGIDDLSDTLNRLVQKKDATMSVQVNVTEVRQPEVDAQLVAENIAVQLEKRISHRRAMRQAMTRAVRMNARGMKINVGGRLGGAEIARREAEKIGKVPLHTIRADIDYGFAIASTIYGSVGVKVWVYKGEVLPERSLTDIPLRKKETAPQPQAEVVAQAAPAASPQAAPAEAPQAEKPNKKRTKASSDKTDEIGAPIAAEAGSTPDGGLQALVIGKESEVSGDVNT